MGTTTKKLQLYPIGEKEEVDRVFTYLRDGIYNQHCILNTYMSQVGCLYYKYNKDFKNVGFKEEFNAIFRNTNEAIKDFTQAKGLGMAGNCGMRVKQDFSTALKNGLARGERNLPFYKRDFPLLVPSRFLTFYTIDSVDKKTGEERTVYCIKFVNGINFKIVIGSQGKKDFYLLPLLDSIINDPDNYHVCGSSIQITKKGKIILNLCVKVSKKAEEYHPKQGRVMGLALGYDKCLVAALSDSDKMFTIGDDIKDSVVEKRIKIQAYNQALQKALKDAKGGHGRARKLAKFNERDRYEKNVVRHFNHVLSKKVVEFAKKQKAETIVIENIDKADLESYPVLLRNWSYYQLCEYIKYKSGDDINVILAGEGKKSKKKAEGDTDTATSAELRKICCKCGCKLDESVILPEKIEWTNELYFTCPECKEKIEFSYNKAKVMSMKG